MKTLRDALLEAVDLGCSTLRVTELRRDIRAKRIKKDSRMQWAIDDAWDELTTRHRTLPAEAQFEVFQFKNSDVVLIVRLGESKDTRTTYQVKAAADLEMDDD